MDFENIISFGAKKRIEERFAQYQKTYRKAEQAQEDLQALHATLLQSLGKLTREQQKIIGSIKKIRKSIFIQVNEEDKLLLKFLKGALKNRRRNLLELSLTEDQVYAYTVSRLSYSDYLGITAAGLAAGAAASAGVAVATTAAGSISAGASVSAAAATSLSVTSAGIGNVAWASVGLLALPLSLACMAGFSHLNANKKIKQLNEAEEALNEKIRAFKDKALLCQKQAAESLEKSEILNFQEMHLSQEFEQYFRKCLEVIGSLSRWKRFKAHICLFLKIENHDIALLKEERSRLKQISLEIYDNITLTTAA
ncbi:hypothetical protein [Phaeodactylibacter xiamenensis]|uniref:hypothetical protein n=1 Tax=Phaeodactylibacter xiamenensis TaxID=1524460 RepID=UPI0024A8BD41|nr:hypothetical protein [Phaeodactylibacter xiamenensis]